jgi:AcrR family transcriptional regulator
MPVRSKGTYRTDKILQEAGKLFARQGYHATSTREIARLADVSENTLFRHFDSKEKLFWSSLQLYSAGLTFRQDLLGGLEQCESPEVVLPKIIEMLSDIVKYRPELLQLIAIAFVEMHTKADEFCLETLSPVLSTINKYLESSIRSGRIRDLDPVLLTTALIMSVLAHPGIFNMTDGNKVVYSNSVEERRAYSKFWMDLVVPRKPVQASLGGQASVDS